MKLVKIDRFFAWVLFISMTLFFVSGYGMTKGIITTQLAVTIHNEILPPVVIIAFTVHAWYAIHLAFKRWRFWNPFSLSLLGLFFVSFLMYFTFLQYFYQQPEDNLASDTTVYKQETQSATKDITDSPEDEPTTQSEIPDSKTFTLQELATFNGKDGQPAYVAVDGDVYDLSSVFNSGKHYSHYAGKELTTAFYSYHIKSSISKYPVVGTLVK